MARFRLQWQQCLRETSRTAAQLTDLLFQFNAAARDEASGDTDININTNTNSLWNTNTNTMGAAHLNDNEDESSGDLPDAGHDADGRDGQTSRDSKCHRHWESTLSFWENPQKMRINIWRKIVRKWGVATKAGSHTYCLYSNLQPPGHLGERLWFNHCDKVILNLQIGFKFDIDGTMITVVTIYHRSSLLQSITDLVGNSWSPGIVTDCRAGQPLDQ